MSSTEKEEARHAANGLYRGIPQVEKLLEDPRMVGWCALLSRPLVAMIVSETLESERKEIRETGTPTEAGDIIRAVEEECRRLSARRIRKVINGTGIILHTNMGRAPLPRSVWDAAADANTGYSDIELDLETGRRGKRNGICPRLLALLTGCEDALVVNNNAAAVLLVLSALARGRDVIVSRGEQVQIGGGFRIPDILALSGARLVEVGTTNVTTLADYTRAITPQTAMVLVVHPSNFRIRGFTEKPGIAEISACLPPHAILVVDQGSGTTTENIPGETKVRSYLMQGSALVCFSGDKVLGGPQAGIIAGRRDLVRAIASHPLARALRPGKTVYSLLEELLVSRLNGAAQGQAERILALPRGELQRMGRRILRNVPKGAASLVEADISTGGGSAPDESSPSLAIELTPPLKAELVLKTLRDLPIPIIGVIEAGKVRLSLATMYGESESYIAASVRAIVAD
jgi:L-seryl-tRNA(Ser) seleniumtransferase